MLKRLLIVMIFLISIVSVSASYGVETDYNILVTQNGFIPTKVTIPEGEYVKFINLGEEVRLISNFYKSKAIEQYGYADVLAHKSGNYRFFIEGLRSEFQLCFRWRI